MTSRPRLRRRRTSGSRGTAAAPTRPGTLARSRPTRRASRARCRCTTLALGSGRLLAIDLDPGRGDVDRQAAELGQLLERLGARYVADVATSPGGRHVLIPFAAALPWRELRDLCRAIAARFPVVDPAPMCSLGGQISPPGSRAKRGGWRVLTTPLSEPWPSSSTRTGRRCGARCSTSSRPSCSRSTRRLRATVELHVPAELDDAGVPWVPRLGGRANLGPELDRAARTGKWDRSRHAGRSEARMAVLCAAAARGWRLADVRSAIASGAWKGVPALYERASEPGRMDRLLPLEWRKSVAFVAGEKNVRHWLTSDVNHAPPALIDGADQFGLIRQWVTGTGCAAADSERAWRWGRRSVAIRMLLAAIGQAAMVSGSSVLEFGTRNLALHSCLSQRTVSRLLRFLCNEPDPLLDVVTRGRMARADRIALRIPDAYADSALDEQRNSQSR